jgi:hypothetical protein
LGFKKRDFIRWLTCRSCRPIKWPEITQRCDEIGVLYFLQQTAVPEKNGRTVFAFVV